MRQGLGAAVRAQAQVQLKQLSRAERNALQSQGIVLGRRYVFYAPALSPPSLLARLALCSAHAARYPLCREPLELAPPLPALVPVPTGNISWSLEATSAAFA